MSPQPLPPFPPPKSLLSNYLVVYAYPDGNVEVNCSTIDPILGFKLLALVANAMCEYQQQAAAPKEQPLIQVVGHG